MRSSTQILGIGARVAAMMSILGCASGIGSRDVRIPPFWVYGQVVTADFNGDGRLDVAVASTFIEGSIHADGVQVYLRNTMGSVEAPITYPVGPGPWGLCAGDLDGDGLLDLIACSLATTAPQLNTPGDSGSLFVLRQNPAAPGHFLPTVWVPTGGAAAAVAVADLDGDGRPEVVVADGVHVNSRVLMLAQAPGQPGVLLPPVTLPVGNGHGPGDLAVADLNGDGRLDLVLAAYDGVVVLYQQAGGVFSGPVQLGSGLRIVGVAVADLDGDGRLDIVAANTRDVLSVDRAGSTLLVLLQTQPGAFTATHLPTVDNAKRVAISDLNGDGRPDIALVSQGPTSKVSVCLQSPLQRGVFAVSAIYEASGLPEFLALGDLNDDGRVDILLSDGPSVLYQTSTAGSFAPPVKLR